MEYVFDEEVLIVMGIHLCSQLLNAVFHCSNPSGRSIHMPQRTFIDRLPAIRLRGLCIEVRSSSVSIFKAIGEVTQRKNGREYLGNEH